MRPELINPPSQVLAPKHFRIHPLRMKPVPRGLGSQNVHLRLTQFLHLDVNKSTTFILEKLVPFLKTPIFLPKSLKINSPNAILHLQPGSTLFHIKELFQSPSGPTPTSSSTSTSVQQILKNYPRNKGLTALSSKCRNILSESSPEKKMYTRGRCTITHWGQEEGGGLE